MGAFTPLYLPHLGVPLDQVAAWTGIIVAVSSAIGLPFLPFWGALADRYSRQPIIVRSFVMHLIAGVVGLLASNVWVFLLARSVMSFSLGNSGLMMTTLSERAPGRRVGLAFSIMNSASSVGAFVGPLFGGPVVDRFGFPTLLAIDVALMIGVVLMLWFGYDDHFKGTAEGHLVKMAAESVRMILRSPRLRTLFPALFLLFAGWMLAFAYLPLVIASLYHGSEPGTVIGIILGGGGLATLLIGPALGHLADSYGHWRVLIAGATVAVVLWPLPAFAPDLVWFGIAWTLLNGVTSAVFAISFSVLSSSATTETRGRVMSFAYLPVNIGYMLGPAIGSIITQVSLLAVFPAAALLTALGIGALIVAFRQGKASS